MDPGSIPGTSTLYLYIHMFRRHRLRWRRCQSQDAERFTCHKSGEVSDRLKRFPVVVHREHCVP